MRRFLTALGFLTRIPAPALKGGAAALGPSVAAFPIVGLLLGGLLVLLDTLFVPLLPLRLANLLLMTVLIVLTGGIHADGFMDTIDGLAGGKDKESTLAIMRDSRVGALGVVGVVLLLLIKWELLNSLEGGARQPALLLMPVMSRWAMALLMRISPSARQDGLGNSFIGGIGALEILGALTVVLSAGWYWSGAAGVFIAAAVSVATIIWSWWFRRKIGGVTGDVIGALNEVIEVLVLLFFVSLA